MIGSKVVVKFGKQAYLAEVAKLLWPQGEFVINGQIFGMRVNKKTFEIKFAFH